MRRELSARRSINTQRKVSTTTPFPSTARDERPFFSVQIVLGAMTLGAVYLIRKNMQGGEPWIEPMNDGVNETISSGNVWTETYEQSKPNPNKS